MLLHSARAGDLSVGDVAHEQMLERILRLARNGGPAVAADELLPFERVQNVLVRAADGARPEDLAEHGSVLHEGLLLRRERVDARGNESLQRLRQGELTAGALGEHARVLARVQRVALGASQHRLLGLGVENSAVEQMLQQARCVVVGERADRMCRRVALAAAPAGPAFEQLGSSGSDDEHRHARYPLGEVVDEVEQRVVRPVQIFEDEDERTLLGEHLEQPAPGCECLELAVAARLIRLAGDARERAQVRCNPPPLLLVGQQLVDHRRELRRGGRPVVVFEDASLRLHDLAERPDASTLAVGERPSLSPPVQVGIFVEDAEELGDEPALADPGHADERDELRRLLATAALERVGEDRQLAVAADNRRACTLLDVDSEPRPRTDDLPDRHRLGLALRFDRLGLAVVDPHEDPVGGRRRLQPRRGVDDVARCHRLAGIRVRVERDERLAGVHGRADPQVGRRLPDRLPDRERGDHGAHRIVFVRDGRSEDRHHRVADELLHRPAALLDLLAKPRVIGREHRPDVLRIELLGTAGEADQVGEKDGDDLPFLATHDPVRYVRSRRSRSRSRRRSCR